MSNKDKLEEECFKENGYEFILVGPEDITDIKEDLKQLIDVDCYLNKIILHHDQRDYYVFDFDAELSAI